MGLRRAEAVHTVANAARYADTLVRPPALELSIRMLALLAAEAGLLAEAMQLLAYETAHLAEYRLPASDPYLVEINTRLEASGMRFPTTGVAGGR